MANEYAVNQADLAAVADAIREKGGTSGALTFPAGFVDAVGAIQAGGGGDGDAIFKGFVEGTLERLEDDSIEEIRAYAFYRCPIRYIKFNNVTYVGPQAFDLCGSTEIYLPSLAGRVDTLARNCSSLAVVDIGHAERIGGNMLNNNPALNIVIIRRDGVAYLASTGAFNNTPFAAGGTGGTVYVPSAWIEEYQNATNWSTLYAGGTLTFAAIEGSVYE